MGRGHDSSSGLQKGVGGVVDNAGASALFDTSADASLASQVQDIVWCEHHDVPVGGGL